MTKGPAYYFKVGFRRWRDWRYNMHTDKHELFFKKLYLHHLNTYFKNAETILEIGCQYGRFTLELLKQNKTVFATDIQEKYGSYIQKNTSSKHFHYTNEPILKTLEREHPIRYDLIVCLEVLHFVGALEELLQSSAKLLNPQGQLIFTVRPKGFFLEKMISIGNFKTLENNKNTEAQNHTYHSLEETKALLLKYGWELKMSAGIGLFSGRPEDRKHPLCLPGDLTTQEQEILFKLETSEENQHWAINKARYILIVATPSINSNK
ncbi:MAG: class I SAM-dependent methyltransferase [Saprospiraceae bacterium]